MTTSLHRHYLELVDEIERVFPVARWRAADLEVWPLARMDLYLDLYRRHVGIAPSPARSLAPRALERFALPIVNLWKSRHDLQHWLARPKPADAIFLGDGVSLDCIDGRWRDRYGEPLMAALQRRGRETFVMQTGDLSRLPWYRPTYAANIVALRGAKRRAWVKAALELPEHAPLMQYLAKGGLNAPSLSERSLRHRAQSVLATATQFESVLRVVGPKLAFVVTYYADLGPAFLLACRRQGILSVDLQHCPHEGAHKAYTWKALPSTGYGVLPAVFWNWTQADAMHIEHWAGQLSRPWHRSVFGGHLQLASFLQDADPATRELDAQFGLISRGVAFEREILVTLQPVSGYRAQWDALAATIEAGPREWRWWIRRHPASRPYQDEEYRRLVSLRRPNVVVEVCSSLPLPALLRHVSVLVSRFSGASAEAESFGVPALFLSEEARGQFSRLIERGAARVVQIGQLIETIARLPRVAVRPPIVAAPQLDETLSRIELFAHDYAQLCRGAGHHDNLASRRNVSESRNSSA